jgi:hypothetical protein
MRYEDFVVTQDTSDYEEEDGDDGLGSMEEDELVILEKMMLVK